MKDEDQKTQVPLAQNIVTVLKANTAQERLILKMWVY